MTTSDWPEDWLQASDEQLRTAVESALSAVEWAGVVEDGGVAPIEEYYRREGNYAGALFTGIEPSDPFDLTAVDLFATTTLSVDIPARAARALLDGGNVRQRVIAALRGVPIDARLETATPAEMSAAAELYGQLYFALGSNPWVTASKLAARKRPALIPVRDRVVIDVLGTGPKNRFQRDWHVIRNLMLNDAVRAALVDLRKVAEADVSTVVEPYDLRLLDVALWRWGTRH